MPQQDPASLAAGVLITLAFFLLIGYIVRSMLRTEVAAVRIATTLIALGSVMVALPAILYALLG
ncbi:hypothetical protein ETD83_18105 [Actinomadura soli]|uniref:Uncharacterized protein n=1 Tax=Actinomadura soli TaxID=2508997 RepID=A0A5C4JBK6_9ACTN|nr:hypothetical protein [Actinomadura soli]TMQ99266.1 hypothetical protein ETD83_18105 [Actinomadura soli]